jgi:hypothetical protein
LKTSRRAQAPKTFGRGIVDTTGDTLSARTRDTERRDLRRDSGDTPTTGIDDAQGRRGTDNNEERQFGKARRTRRRGQALRTLKRFIGH